jgi:hypothetical protein
MPPFVIVTGAPCWERFLIWRSGTGPNPSESTSCPDIDKRISTTFGVPRLRVQPEARSSFKWRGKPYRAFGPTESGSVCYIPFRNASGSGMRRLRPTAKRVKVCFLASFLWPLRFSIFVPCVTRSLPVCSQSFSLKAISSKPKISAIGLMRPLKRSRHPCECLTPG